MTELRIEPYLLPAAEIGPENPLPLFRAPQHDTLFDFDAHNIPEEDRPGFGCATGRRVLPWRMQDDYTRVRRERAFTAIMLENDMLRVTVLPEIGGKVASIFDKCRELELIYRNPVFQPGNLALRNAWTSGGIEWNTGHVGHHYRTCAPIHCARVAGPDGAPVLRLYAWERVHRYTYHIDLHLPPGSPFLFARVRIINPHERELPMYWWTNIGLLEHEGGRVLAPADTAYRGRTVFECPVYGGIDHSYSTRVNRAYDLFFRIPKDRRPWEAYFGPDGCGFVHTSTARLIGRKQFAWGMGRGGRRWCEYLAVPDMPYIEVQAGLAYTQSHTVPMPRRTEWTWTEAMGYFEGDPALLHSESWQQAYRAGERMLEETLPRAEVERVDAQLAGVATRPPEELLYRGDGWAALELRRAAAMGDESGIPPELPFDDEDLGGDQEPWLRLLETGALPERDPMDEPGQFQVQEQWHSLLEDSVMAGHSDHWLGWLHLGIMRMEAGDTDGAREAWRRSLERAPNGWALRNLSVIASRDGDEEGAAELLAQALQVGPMVRSLAEEYATLLLQLKRFDVLDRFLAEVSAPVRMSERLRMAAGWAALHAGRLDEVEQVLRGEFAGIREGELTLSELWFALQEQRLARAEGVEVDDALRARVRRDFPPPREIDFRMSAEGEEQYVPPQAT